jgi:hypothetical protein
MNTRDLIIETLKNGSTEDKAAMIRACEESVMEYALKEIKDLLDAFNEIDQTKLTCDEDTKTKFYRLYAKLNAIKLIGGDYNNIEIRLVRGKTIVRGAMGVVSHFSANNKRACQINLWSGMPKFSTDSKDLDTEEY